MGASWANGATITVNPGSSISAAINAAQIGDIVQLQPGIHLSSGVTVNKSIVLEGKPGAILRDTTSGFHTGVRFTTNHATVRGLQVENFNVAFSASGSRTNIRIVNNHSINAQFHVYISGSAWLVQGNEFEACRLWSGNDDTDYIRITGSGHVVRRNWFHGTQLPSGLLRNDGQYAHNDVIQFEGWIGANLHDCVFEENMCMDFVQGFWLSDDSNINAIRNVVIRNNIFWGTTYPAPPQSNLLGAPSWMIGVAKNYGARDIVIANNLFYRGYNYIGLRADTQATLRKNLVYGAGSGTVYAVSANTNPQGNIAEMGSLLWSYGSLGALHPNTNVSFNPQFRNISNPLGVDGIPFTRDDGWIPLNSAADSFGPQIFPLDSDSDLLPDDDEINIYGTDPYDMDTDDDGVIDGTEIQLGTDPLDPGSFPILGIQWPWQGVLAVLCIALGCAYTRKTRFSRIAAAVRKGDR